MKSAAPPLLPLLRSRAQAELLTLVLLNPEHEWSLTELASRTGTSLATSQREVTRAEQAGVVTSHRVGNTRLVTASPSPLTEPMATLLLRSFGPRHVLSEALEDIPGIEAAFIFGSWAARYEGRQGHAPADVDVLVIGTPDRDELDDAAQRASWRISREVNVTIRSPEWWREGTDGFHAEVTSRPLIGLFGRRPGGGGDAE